MELVLIGIPVYKPELSLLEKIALEQLKNVLGNYKIIFIAPFFLKKIYEKSFQTICFNDKYFVNRESYSELLLSEFFYNQFTDYKYLLIYQLDAFVFKDELMKYCNMGYDYIGAPVVGSDWRFFHVGNGGLSLRNVQKSLAMVTRKEEIKKKMYTLMSYDYFAEDLFFSYCGYDKELDFHVPSPRLASTFSAEMDYAHGLRDIAERGLPFGCHYWSKMNYDFWKGHIESYGYTLPDISSENTLHADTLRRTRYLMKRYIRDKKWIRSNDFISIFLKDNKRICIFGAGILGRECVDFFLNIPGAHRIIKIFDNKAVGKIAGIEIVKPDRNSLFTNNEVVVIATVKYEKEIIASLREYGIEWKEKVFSISQMLYDDYGIKQRFMGESYVNHTQIN